MEKENTNSQFETPNDSSGSTIESKAATMGYSLDPTPSPMNATNGIDKPAEDLSLFVSAIAAMKDSSSSDATTKKKRQSDTPVPLTDKDVIDGDNWNHPGNQRYYQLIQQYCADVVKDPTTVVQKVMDHLEGSFLIQEDGLYYVMDPATVQSKVEATLQSASKVMVNRKRLLEEVDKNNEEEFASRKKRAPSTTTSCPQDVLGDESKQPNNPGNVLFRELVSNHFKGFGPDKHDIFVYQIIHTIQAQGGRFLAANNRDVLSDAQAKAKVWVALNHEQSVVVDRREPRPSTAAAAAAAPQYHPDEDDGSPRKSDVLGGLGRLKNNPGNILFRDLVALHVEEYGQPGKAATVISRVLAAINNQNPPGRFLSSNNQTVLSNSQSRNKVRLALHNKLMKIRQGNGVATTTTPTTPASRAAALSQVYAQQEREPGEVAVENTHPMDVFGDKDDNPGNVLYRQLVSMNVVNFSSSTTMSAASNQAVIDSIVKAIYSAGGRFLSPNNDYVLSQQKTNAKVWVALHREEELKGGADNNSLLLQHVDMTTTTSLSPVVPTSGDLTVVVSSGSDEDTPPANNNNNGASVELMESVETWCEV